MILNGTLQHDIPAGSCGEREVFDREGYAVGRQVLAQEVLRELRAPVVDALIADGHIEPVEGEEDRFRWVGDAATFDSSCHGYRPARVSAVDELLMRSGLAAAAVEHMWGRRPAFWEGVALFAMVPGGPTRPHRDGWMTQGVGAPGDHFNLWVPLTRLDEEDGPLAFAIGSHRISDQPARVPVSRPMHQDVLANTGNPPPAEVLDPLWRTTRLEVGDALLFRPDIIHSSAPNDGPYLRMAFTILGQDASLPLPPQAGLSLDATRELSDIEWLTLAILAVQPSSPRLARQAFFPRGIIHRIWPEESGSGVNRAFVTLRARGLIEPHEPPDETVAAHHHYFHATERGRNVVSAWLTTPSRSGAHLLSVKLLFCDWLGLDAARLLVQ